jgi:Flp pilus assembly protein TadD
MNAHKALIISGTMLMLLLAACDAPDIRKGSTALGLGDYTLAIHLFGRVLEHDPASFDARLGMGKALLQRFIDMNDTAAWRDAVMHLEAARTISGGAEPSKLLAQVWAQRGTERAHAGDTVGALDALSRAISCDPQAVEPLNRAGIIYFRTGKTAKARQLFKSAIAADSSNVSSLFNLGMLYWEENNPREAHRLWLQALSRSPNDEDFLYWFAAAEKRLREENAAAAGDSIR